MIGGMPYRLKDAFFGQLLQLLQEHTGYAIEGKVVSLGGFPAHKAASHVKRALDPLPQYVVVQLGSTDIMVSVKHTLRKRLGLARKKEQRVPPQESGVPVCGDEEPMTLYRTVAMQKLLDWVRQATCTLLRIQPMHGDEHVYLPAMEKVIVQIKQAGAVPVILAPFPFGDVVSHAWSGRFASLLRDLVRRHDAIFVDTYQGLAPYPWPELLLADGLHLSRLGHQKVAAMLLSAILAHLPQEAS
jgi:lysophospholipase L1-like esterase